MLIQKASDTFVDLAAWEKAVESLLTSGEMFKRPCQGCSKACDDCGSQYCLCGCSSRCPEIARALSSDPDKYPIEPRVVELVFEMSRFREMQPCWSCEGHLDPEGNLWKVPQVWFYAASPIYVSLLSQHVWQLHASAELFYPWQVNVLAYGQITGTTYSLIPNLNCVEKPSLDNLQKDMKRMSFDLVGQLMMLALKQRDQHQHQQQ